MKILHLADIHARDKDISEIEKCLGFIVETARADPPDIIINAGDTFDSSGIKADSLSSKLIFKTFKELADIAPVAVVIGTPSHDGLVAETLQYIKARYPVHVSTHPQQLYLCEGDLNPDPSKLFAPDQAPIEAVFSMCPTPTKQYFTTESDIKGADSEIAQAMSAMFTGFADQAAAYDHCPHVLVGHWNITGSLVSETQTLTGVDIELSKEQMALSNADICLMGHIHKAQKLESNIFYSGSIVPLTWGELDAKGFYIHTLEDKNLIESNFIKTPSRKLIKLAEDLTSEGDIALAVDLFQGKISSIDAENANIKVEIKVFQNETQRIDTEEIEKILLDNGAHSAVIQLIRMPRENVRSQKILKLTTLRDKLVEMAALKGETVPESILGKADRLESEDPDKIVQMVASR